MSEVTREFGIRITADGKVSVTALREVSEATDQLTSAARRMSDATADTAKAHAEAKSAADRYIATLREEAETFSMSAMQKRAYRAAQLDMTAAQQDTAAALITSIDRHEQQSEAVRKLTGYAIAAGAALTAYAGAVALSVKRAIDQAAAMSTLSEKTGIATERLGGLKYAAEMADTSIESLARAFAHLPRSLVEGKNPNSEAGRAFAFLGIDPAQLKTQEQAIDAIANAIQRVEDPMAKAAALQMIYKRNGEELIPLFNKGADGIRRLTEEGERWNRISGTTAEQARELKDQMTTLQVASGELGRSIASDIIPYLSKMIEQLLEGKRIAGGFFNAIVMFGTQNPFKSPGESARGLRIELDALIEKRDRYAAQGFSGWATALDGDIAKLQKRYEFIKLLQRQEALAGTGTIPDPNLQRVLGGTKIPGMPDSRGAGGLSTQISDYDRLTKSINEKIAVSRLDLQSGEKLTEGQKLAAKVMVELRDGTLQLTDTQKIRVTALLEELIGVEQNITAEERDKKAREETLAVIEKMNRLARDEVDAITKRTTSIEDQVATYGKSKDAIEEVTIARLEERKAFLLQVDDSGAMVEKINNEIAARRGLINVIQSTDAAAAVKKAADAEIAEFRRADDEIRRGLTDSLMRGFEKGESFAKNFWDSTVNMAKTSVLRPVIQWVVSPISGTITAALSGLGIPGLANAAGAGSNLLSGGSWLTSLFGGSAITTSSGAITAGASSTSAALAGMDAGIVAAGSSAGAVTAGTTLLSTITAAAPYVAAAVAAAKVFGLFDDDETPHVSTAWLQKDDKGRFNVGMSDDDTNLTQVLAANKLLQDPTKYDPAKLDKLLGTTVSTGGKADTATLLALLDTALKDVADSTRDALKIADLNDILKRMGIEAVDATASMSDYFLPGLQEIDEATAKMWEDMTAAADSGTETIYELWQNQDAALRDLANAYDGSTDSAKALATGIDDYTDAAVAAYKQINQLSDTSSTGFKDTIRSIRYGALADDKDRYGFLDKEIAWLQDQITSSKDAKLTADYAKDLRDDVLAAFNLLPDDQKASRADEFIEILDRNDALVQSRFDAEREEVKAAAKESAAEIEKAVTRALNTWTEQQTVIANTQKAAADTALTAANTPTKVDVTVHVDGGGTEVG